VGRYVKWEDSKGRQPDEPGGCWDVERWTAYFPHVHGNGLKVGREEVDVLGISKRGPAGWGVDGWPFDEDRPKAV
jgi:hypothetical protein